MSRGTDMRDRARHLAERGPLERLLQGPIQLGRDWLVGFVRLQGFDRAVALAGQTFTALIPLLIVYSAVVSRRTGNDFADQIIKAFDLHGSAASSVKQAIASSNEVENEVSVFGALLLIVSALSFTRGLQRLYQLAFDQPSLGLRAAKWGLIWLAIVIAILTARPVVLSPFHGLTLLLLSIGVSALLWLVTPYILLARRIPWQRLVATAVLTSIGMTGLTLASAVWMPHSVAVSAEQFGTIGIAFALLSWLVGAGLVLVVAAAGGAVIDTRLRGRAQARRSANPHHPAG
jgi:membrane protein